VGTKKSLQRSDNLHLYPLYPLEKKVGTAKWVQRSACSTVTSLIYLYLYPLYPPKKRRDKSPFEFLLCVFGVAFTPSRPPPTPSKNGGYSGYSGYKIKKRLQHSHFFVPTPENGRTHFLIVGTDGTLPHYNFNRLVDAASTRRYQARHGGGLNYAVNAYLTSRSGILP
jgi:hypothetical protein